MNKRQELKETFSKMVSAGTIPIQVYVHSLSTPKSQQVKEWEKLIQKYSLLELVKQAQDLNLGY